MEFISELGEFGLIERLAARIPPYLDDVHVGVGDDCAVLGGGADGELILLTTDSQIEDVHFKLSWISPRDLGRRAAAVNVSDVAAMGGEPRHFLLSLGIPDDIAPDYLESVYDGFAQEAERWGADIVGGNVTRSYSFTIGVTLIGVAQRERLLRRTGARIGDRVFVTGQPGISRAGFEELSNPRLEVYVGGCVEAHRTPTPRLYESRFISASGAATAMIDVSDGLAADLGHLCRASGVGAEIELSCLPISPDVEAVARAAGVNPMDWILGGGEDYELLFTVRPDASDGFGQALLDATGTPATEIGTICEETLGIRGRDAKGNLGDLGARGWDHFG